jgi:hypothetical protein
MHGVICAGVILSVMGAAFFFYVLCAPHPWPVCLVCAGTDWLVPKSPVAFHTLGLGLLPVCITPSTPTFSAFTLITRPKAVGFILSAVSASFVPISFVGHAWMASIFTFRISAIDMGLHSSPLSTLGVDLYRFFSSSWAW